MIVVVQNALTKASNMKIRVSPSSSRDKMKIDAALIGIAIREASDEQDADETNVLANMCVKKTPLTVFASLK